MAKDNTALFDAFKSGNIPAITKILSSLFVKNSVVFCDYNRKQITEAYSNNDVLFSAINKIAWAVQNLRIVPAEIGKDGSITEKLDSELALFCQKRLVNEFVVNYLLFGESFIYAPKLTAGNNRGKLAKPDTGEAILILPSEVVEIKSNSPFDIVGYLVEGMMSDPLQASDVIHIKNVNPDWRNLHGVPFVKVAGKQIDKINSVDEIEVKNFQNGGPAYVVSPKDDMAAPLDGFAGFIERFKKKFFDPKNKGGIVGVNNAIVMDRVGDTPVDLGTVESRKAAVRSLSVIFNLDPGIFDTDASTVNNKATMLAGLYTQAAIPIATIYRDGVSEAFKEAYGTELIVDSSEIDVLKKNVGEQIKAMQQVQAFTLDEIRDAAGYQKLENELGVNVWRGVGEDTLDSMISIQSEENVNGDIPMLDTTGNLPATEIQALGLNGAQIQSLIAIVDTFSIGTFDEVAARAMIQAAFPTMAPALIDKILNGVTPKPQPTV